MSELPENWGTAPLSAISSDVPQRVPDLAERFTYIDIGSIDRETKTIAAPQVLLGRDAPSRARKQVATGDTLVSMTRPNLNAVALVPPSLDGQIASTGFDVLRPLAGIDPRWLAYLVRTENFVSAMSELVQGALYPAVRTKDVRAYEAPIAPSEEQTRIADQLDTLLTRINACQHRLNNIPVLLKRFRQAVLERALSGHLTMAWRETAAAEIDAWKSVTLGDIADVGTGSTPLRSNASYFANSGMPWVTSAATGSPYVTGTKEYVTPVAISSHRLKVYAPGTLLVAMYGEGKTRGQVTELRIHATINQACAAVKVDESRANIAFVKLVLWSQYEQTRALAEGGNQPNLNLSKVKGIPIQLPPLREQAEIVRRIEALFKLVAYIGDGYTAAFAQVQRLPSLVLAKAFRGELVPQDPCDEPASNLLARIATLRKSATPVPKTRQPCAPRAARAPKESVAMTKSRQDADVKDKPYLAGHLRRLGEPVAARALFQVAELPVADFYKQLAWEVAQGHVKDNTTTLESVHAAG